MYDFPKIKRLEPIFVDFQQMHQFYKSLSGNCKHLFHLQLYLNKFEIKTRKPYQVQF